jgi:hypothetical protein
MKSKGERLYYPVAFFGGIFAALAMTLIMGIYRELGFSGLRLESSLGTILTGHAGIGSWLAGLAWHLLNGGIFGLIYAAGFRAIHRGGGGLGMAFGFIHWCLAGYIIGVFPVWRLPALVQLAPWLSNPRLEFGGIAALVIFSLHLLFGFILGSLCEGMLAAERVEHRSEREHQDQSKAA